MEWGGISVDADEDSTNKSVEDYEVLVTESSLLEWAVACLSKAGADEAPARTKASILLVQIRGVNTAMALIGWIYTAMISRVRFVNQSKFQLLIMKQQLQLLLMEEMVLVEL